MAYNVDTEICYNIQHVKSLLKKVYFGSLTVILLGITRFATLVG